MRKFQTNSLPKIIGSHQALFRLAVLSRGSSDGQVFAAVKNFWFQPNYFAEIWQVNKENINLILTVRQLGPLTSARYFSQVQQKAVSGLN